MRLCNCGSGKPSGELYDARGIYCGRVCAACECNAYEGDTYYGQPIGTVDRGDICMDGMSLLDTHVNWNDEASVRRYVIGQLGLQGIKLQK